MGIRAGPRPAPAAAPSKPPCAVMQEPNAMLALSCGYCPDVSAAAKVPRRHRHARGKVATTLHGRQPQGPSAQGPLSSPRASPAAPRAPPDPIACWPRSSCLRRAAEGFTGYIHVKLLPGRGGRRAGGRPRRRWPRACPSTSRARTRNSAVRHARGKEKDLSGDSSAQSWSWPAGSIARPAKEGRPGGPQRQPTTTQFVVGRHRASAIGRCSASFAPRLRSAERLPASRPLQARSSRWPARPSSTSRPRPPARGRGGAYLPGRAPAARLRLRLRRGWRSAPDGKPAARARSQEPRGRWPTSEAAFPLDVTRATAWSCCCALPGPSARRPRGRSWERRDANQRSAICGIFKGRVGGRHRTGRASISRCAASGWPTAPRAAPAPALRAR